MGHCCPGILALQHGRGPRQLGIRACLCCIATWPALHAPGQSSDGPSWAQLAGRETAQLATGHGPAGHGP